MLRRWMNVLQIELGHVLETDWRGAAAQCRVIEALAGPIEAAPHVLD